MIMIDICLWIMFGILIAFILYIIGAIVLTEVKRIIKLNKK